MKNIAGCAARFAFASLLIVCVRGSRAQELPFPLEMPVPGVESYDPSIPTPEAVIGHRIGTSHTMPYQVQAYFEAVASASPRVKVEQHAQSYEGRTLLHAIVSSPENMDRLEEIRERNLLLSDRPESVTDDDISLRPSGRYQGYSIHGNEASGTEAAVLYLYHLAAAEGPDVEETLRNAVIILDPMFNPDGRDRFTDWVNRNRGRVPVADRQDREHNEPWPGGRTNHYWFDLNRDWLVSQHPESQGRLRLFHAWRPQVLTDHHEMGAGSTFFFQPGIPSRNNPNTPERTYELTAAIAEYHAKALDRIGSLYYSKESFDDFFYGKGSAYPDVNGAIGILFEQASSRALKTETGDGTLDYAFTIRNQFAASLSTLEAGVRLRRELLRHQRDFYTESLELAKESKVKAYVVSMDRGHTRAQILAQLFQRHRVELYALASDVTLEGRTFRAGASYVVPLEQRQMRLVKSAMERTLVYEDSLFYDVSTWTLPLAHDVDYAELRSDPDRIMGAPLGPVQLDGGVLQGGRATYAYLMSWDRYFAPRSLDRFLEAGVPVRVARAAFSTDIDGKRTDFAPGTIVIPLAGRSSGSGAPDADLIHALVATCVREDHTRFQAVATGLTPEGPDLGGASTSLLVRPKIAVLTGSRMSSSVAGEAWHLLSERFLMPVSLVEADRLAAYDLDRYSVVVHPGGSLSDEASSALVSWTRRGGRLILFSGALSWAASEELLTLDEKPFELDSVMKDLPYDRLDEARGAQAIGGSIFDLSIDTTHPIGYGLPPHLPVFHNDSRFYEAPADPGTAVGIYFGGAPLSGYISDEKARLLEGSAGAVAVRSGRGRVVAFMDRLSFRAYWYGSQRLFLNAVFFGAIF